MGGYIGVNKAKSNSFERGEITGCTTIIKWLCWSSQKSLFQVLVMRPLLPVLALVFLSGCGMQVKQLDAANPSANDFPSALASEYHDYADSEYEQGRYSSAGHFAGKGLDSLNGKSVDPDAVNGSLPADEQKTLSDSRAQLVKFLNEDIKRVSPQKLAHAQLLFDCWQNELLKDISQTKAPCQEEFHSTMAELQEVSDNLVYGKETNHVVLFAAKSTSLDESALASIKEVAEHVKGMPHYRVLLVAYVGHRTSQRHLTEARLSAVRHALVKAGIADKHIRITKTGGAKAVVLSRDKIAMDTKKITIIVKTTHGKS